MTTTTTKKSRAPRSRSRRGSDRRRRADHPRTLDFLIQRRPRAGSSTGSIPSRLVLVRLDPRDASGDELFLDQIPIPRDAWRYDPQDRVLSWSAAFGGGHLYLSRDGRSATGNIGPLSDLVSVVGSAKAVFTCDVALGCGATYSTSGQRVIGFTWDPTSDAWKNATWVKARLQLGYTVAKSDDPMAPPTLTFTFKDLLTGADPWNPAPDSVKATLGMDMQNGRMGWSLNVKSLLPPDPDSGNPAPGPDTVYPYWMQAVEDAAAATINGVLEIDDIAPNGTLVGLQGTRADAPTAGYFRTSPGAAPFGVFDGKLTVGGQPLSTSEVIDGVLRWRGLDPALQRRTRLPERGSVLLEGRGAPRSHERHTTAHRLSTSAAAAAIAAHEDLHPAVHAQCVAVRSALADATLDMPGLMAMTPFAQDANKNWGDLVQAAVTQDLGDIMNSFVPGNLWDAVFSGVPQPTLSGELAVVASAPVPGVADPKSFYTSLATAVLTEGLASGSDDKCKYLNGPRAAAWLRSQVAGSRVYYTHSQLLFQYEWQKRFPLTAQYLTDQIQNAGKHAADIDAQVARSVADINANIVNPSGQDIKSQLITQVQESGQYAKDKSLFWAFAFFTYNTAPAILANIAMQMGMDTGSSDGTSLTRLFQQNVAVLTALDPSGYFARQYTGTLNVFLATSVLPNMFDFAGSPDSFDAVSLYLQRFVDDNLHSEDQQIAAAAATLKAFLDSKDSADKVRDALGALRAISGLVSDTLSLPFVAQRFEQWFQQNCAGFEKEASLLSSVIFAGSIGVGIYCLMLTGQGWHSLNAGQQGQVVTAAVQFGLQIVAGVVKRAARIYALFEVEEMGLCTGGFRPAMQILLTGSAEKLDQALRDVGRGMARWLGGKKGGALAGAAEEESLLAGEEETDLVGSLFGRNLDEFIATRIGPLFILAGIAFNIYSLTTGESGIPLASDILNLVSGSLMIFATVGGWALAGETAGLLATLVSCAGALSVVAALAGVALMLYELFSDPPDPVQQFVDDYARPAGFAVYDKCASIDYAVPYINADQGGLLMVGFSLTGAGKALLCRPDGSIGLGAATSLPECVWQATTDGSGMSQITAVLKQPSASAPEVRLLSLLSDGTVSFQPPMAPAPASGGAAPAGPTVVTQTWIAAPVAVQAFPGVFSVAVARTSDDRFLASLPITLQPVLPDAKGQYAPSQASGWLSLTASGVTVQAAGGTPLTLTMSGVAPNLMAMDDIQQTLGGTPSTSEVFGPRFGLAPSTPCTYSLTGTLPAFLTFTAETGTISPNGGVATPASQGSYTLSAKNALGSAQAQFQIIVSAPTPSAAPGGA